MIMVRFVYLIVDISMFKKEIRKFTSMPIWDKKKLDFVLIGRI